MQITMYGQIKIILLHVYICDVQYEKLCKKNILVLVFLVGIHAEAQTLMQAACAHARRKAKLAAHM